MLTRTKRTALSLTSITLILAASAVTSAAPTAASTCRGFNHTDTQAYYEHCGGGPVVVDLTVRDGEGDINHTSRCVDVGNTWLGRFSWGGSAGISYARSDGNPC